MMCYVEKKERLQFQLNELLSQLEVENKKRQELSDKLELSKTKILTKNDVNELHEQLKPEQQPEDPKRQMSQQDLELNYIDQIRILTAEKKGLLEALQAAQSFISDLEKEIQTYKNESKKMDHKESATSTGNELYTQLKAEKEALFEKNQVNTKQIQLLQTQIQQQQKQGMLWQTLLGVAVLLLAFALYV